MPSNHQFSGAISGDFSLQISLIRSRMIVKTHAHLLYEVTKESFLKWCHPQSKSDLLKMNNINSLIKTKENTACWRHQNFMTWPCHRQKPALPQPGMGRCQCFSRADHVLWNVQCKWSCSHTELTSMHGRRTTVTTVYHTHIGESWLVSMSAVATSVYQSMIMSNYMSSRFCCIKAATKSYRRTGNALTYWR